MVRHKRMEMHSVVINIEKRTMRVMKKWTIRKEDDAHAGWESQMRGFQRLTIGVFVSAALDAFFA